MVYLWAFIAAVLAIALVIVVTVLVKKGKESDRYRREMAQANADLSQLQRNWREVAGASEEAVERARQLEAEVERQKNELRSYKEVYSIAAAKSDDCERRAQELQRALDAESSGHRLRANEAASARERLAKVEPELAAQVGVVAELRARVEHLEWRFGNVIDIDAEAVRLRDEVKDLVAKRRELRMIEEDLTLAEVGVYKPHFELNDSARYKIELEKHYKKHKAFVKANKATVFDKRWTVDGDKREGQKLSRDLSKLVMRAFNAECEAAISNVRWSNFAVMKNRIIKAFETINKLVTRWKLSLTNEYMQLWLQELILTHEHKEQLEKEREEQRRINEQLREEARAQRELEKAQKDAEESEHRIAEALEKERAKAANARAEDAEKFGSRIAQLEAALAEAHAKAERAKSMAELTKAGHVYIISNIGSFGEGVFKIGMTRREDPNDRIRELGDASVPFLFDIHGMIYSEDAPKLEHELHVLLAARRVNLVNERKEFFRVSIDEIVEACRQLGSTVELTMLAEAKEYRQTEALRKQGITTLADEEQLKLAFGRGQTSAN